MLSRGQEITVQMVREHLSHYEEPVEVSSLLPMPIGKSVQEAERELIYKALVSLGLEMKEMREAILQLSSQINGQQSNGFTYSPVESIDADAEIKPLEDMERDMIVKALDKFRGNRRKVARALNISERTLYRKIKEYDIV